MFYAAAYSLGCHDGALIDRRLYRTFQSLTVNRTETATSICREVSVATSSTVLDQSTRNWLSVECLQSVNSDKLSKFVNAINGNEGTGYERWHCCHLHYTNCYFMLSAFTLSVEAS